MKESALQYTVQSRAFQFLLTMDGPEYYGIVLTNEASLDREINEEVPEEWKPLDTLGQKNWLECCRLSQKELLNLANIQYRIFLMTAFLRALSVLFEQAHLCYLFNLEIPCAMTCGSLIEEAIEVKFSAAK